MVPSPLKNGRPSSLPAGNARWHEGRRRDRRRTVISFLHLPGQQKMIDRLDPRYKTMSRAIASHRRASMGRMMIERPLDSGWSLLRYSVLAFVRWREKRALLKLIVLDPVDANDAREKLVYLMAAMMAHHAPNDEGDIRNAIATLKPFVGTLSRCLRP